MTIEKSKHIYFSENWVISIQYLEVAAVVESEPLETRLLFGGWICSLLASCL
jgi:hypothetical protein